MKSLLFSIFFVFILSSWHTMSIPYELTTLEKSGYFEDLNRAKLHPTLVKHLNLKYQNLITVPVDVYYFKQLEILDLSHNQLTKIDADIENLLNLKKLYINSNQITELPGNFNKLKITLLNIQKNPINDLVDLKPFLPETLGELLAGNPDPNEVKHPATVVITTDSNQR